MKQICFLLFTLVITVACQTVKQDEPVAPMLDQLQGRWIHVSGGLIFVISGKELDMNFFSDGNITGTQGSYAFSDHVTDPKGRSYAVYINKNDTRITAALTQVDGQLSHVGPREVAIKNKNPLDFGYMRL